MWFVFVLWEPRECAGTCVLLGPAADRPSLQKLLYCQECWELLWSSERAVGGAPRCMTCSGFYQTEGEGQGGMASN